MSFGKPAAQPRSEEKAPVTTAAPPPTSADQEPTPNELERLREILYGNQARSTEKRLEGLEMRLDAVHHELSDAVSQRVGALADSSAAQLAAIRKE